MNTPETQPDPLPPASAVTVMMGWGAASCFHWDRAPVVTSGGIVLRCVQHTSKNGAVTFHYEPPNAHAEARRDQEPRCPRCGVQGVLISRKEKYGLQSQWQCWAWKCRHIWNTPNAQAEARRDK